MHLLFVKAVGGVGNNVFNKIPRMPRMVGQIDPQIGEFASRITPEFLF